MITLCLSIVFSLSPKEQERSIQNWNRIAASRPGAAQAKENIEKIIKEKEAKNKKLAKLGNCREKPNYKNYNRLNTTYVNIRLPSGLPHGRVWHSGR